MDILDTMLNHFIYAKEKFITNSIAVKQKNEFILRHNQVSTYYKK